MSETSRRTCLVRTGPDVRSLDDADLHTIDELLADPDVLVWLDILDPTTADLELLVAEFGVHPLAIEDLRNRGQRAKLDTYGDRHVVVVYEVVVGPAARRGSGSGSGSEQVQDHAHEHEHDHEPFAEMHLFAGAGYIVTVRWADSPAVELTRRRFQTRTDVVAWSAGGLLYAILDAVVDGYFPLVDEVNDLLEDLEPALLSPNASQDGLRRLLELKRTMLGLRRVAAPLRDVANSLLRREAPLIDDKAVPYYNDLYDHLVRVIDSLDLLRDLVAATLDANLAATNNALNLIVKRLTAVTVILMVPTLIAGIYGMNFEFMPELAWPLGYPFALGLMALAVGSVIVYFRRHGWF